MGNRFKYGAMDMGDTRIQAVWFNKQENNVDVEKDNGDFLEINNYKEIEDYLEDVIS